MRVVKIETVHLSLKIPRPENHSRPKCLSSAKRESRRRFLCTLAKQFVWSVSCDGSFQYLIFNIAESLADRSPSITRKRIKARTPLRPSLSPGLDINLSRYLDSQPSTSNDSARTHTRTRARAHTHTYTELRKRERGQAQWTRFPRVRSFRSINRRIISTNSTIFLPFRTYQPRQYEEGRKAGRKEGRWTNVLRNDSLDFRDVNARRLGESQPVESERLSSRPYLSIYQTFRPFLFRSLLSSTPSFHVRDVFLLFSFLFVPRRSSVVVFCGRGWFSAASRRTAGSRERGERDFRSKRGTISFTERKIVSLSVESVFVSLHQAERRTSFSSIDRGYDFSWRVSLKKKRKKESTSYLINS